MALPADLFVLALFVVLPVALWCVLPAAGVLPDAEALLSALPRPEPFLGADEFPEADADPE